MRLDHLVFRFANFVIILTPKQELTEILLLNLSPLASADDSVSCALEVVLMNQAQGYEALSYTWDGQSVTYTITLDSDKSFALREIYFSLSGDCDVEMNHANYGLTLCASTSPKRTKK